MMRIATRSPSRLLALAVWASATVAPVLFTLPQAIAADSNFHLQEASITSIQSAIQAKKITSVQLVNLYLARIKAYNGTAVKEPDGILGKIETIPHAGK